MLKHKEIWTKKKVNWESRFNNVKQMQSGLLHENEVSWNLLELEDRSCFSNTLIDGIPKTSNNTWKLSAKKVLKVTYCYVSIKTTYVLILLFAALINLKKQRNLNDAKILKTLDFIVLRIFLKTQYILKILVGIYFRTW